MLRVKRSISAFFFPNFSNTYELNAFFCKPNLYLRHLTYEMLMKSQTINSTELTLKVQNRHAGDRESCFNELLKRFHGQALSTAWRLLGNHHAQAEDTVQTAFQKAWENFEQLENPNRLKSWFFQILVNECRNVQRRHKTRKTLRQIFLPWEQESGATRRARSWYSKTHSVRHAKTQRETTRGIRAHSFRRIHQPRSCIYDASVRWYLKSHLHRATTTLRQELHDIHPHAEETR